MALTVAALQCGCATKEDPKGVTPVFRSEVMRLQERTSPELSDARVTFVPQAYDESAEARWNVITVMKWPQYSRWVQAQLVPEFSVDTANAQALIFRKRLEADIFVLSLAPDSLRLGLVHVNLWGSPW